MNMIAGKEDAMRPAMFSTSTTAGQEHYVRVKYISSMSQGSRNTHAYTYNTKVYSHTRPALSLRHI
jgi:hypothetical protein